MTGQLSFSQSSDYFQQKVDYIINVELNENRHSLKGDISINYFNNSGDTLNKIWFHLYPNAYRNENTRFAKQILKYRKTDFHFSDKDERGYIDSLYFTVNGSHRDLEISDNIDIGNLSLETPLLPGDSIRIHTPFYVKIPKIYSRLGHSGNSYYISQWYPKPAVYDKNGWHTMPYLHMGEYYSEFGNYTVNINIPAGYKIAASGVLKSKDEREWLLNEDKSKEHKNKFKTVTYKAENVHDFAWFADKNFKVKHQYYHDSIDIFAFYLPGNEKEWSKVPGYVTKTIDFYSQQIGKTGFKSFSVVQGKKNAGGGMEYPGVTIISSIGTEKTLERVVMHEIGHNWFYGELAFNERDYPWLDEGLNSFYENKYMDLYYPDTSDTFELRDIFNTPYLNNDNNLKSELLYKTSRSIEKEQSANLSSAEYTPLNYMSIVYNKTVSAFYYLENYLGEEEFRNIMNNFFIKWKYKHPQAENLKHFFEKESGKNLDWFFEELIGSTKNIDYKIKRIKNDSIIIENNGDINAPVFYGTMNNVRISDGFEGEKIFYFDHKKEDVLWIDPEYKMLEYKRENNRYEKKIFPKLNPLKINFFAGIDDFNQNELFFTPVPAFNALDGFMPGLLIYNNIIPVKNTEFSLMPLYGVKTNHLTGTAKLRYRKIFSNKLIKSGKIGFKAKRFSLSESDTYHKLKTNFGIEFNTSSVAAHSVLDFNYIITSSILHYQKLRYTYHNYRSLNPYKLSAEIEHGKAYIKSGINAKYCINYNSKSGLKIDFFAGYLNYYDFENHPNNVNFYLSGTSSSNDYLYEANLIDRSLNMYDYDNLFARQFIPNEGGFTIYTPLQSDSWLGRLRVTSGTPFSFIKIYGNTAILPQLYDNDNNFNETAFYEAGLEISIFKDVLEIFVPVLYSENLRDINEKLYSENFWQKIRFKLSLQALNPFKLRYKTHLLY